MLNVEQLTGLEKGDLVETMPLLAGASPEPIVLRVAAVGPETVAFVATWHGVTLGRWTATILDGEVEWNM